MVPASAVPTTARAPGAAPGGSKPRVSSTQGGSFSPRVLGARALAPLPLRVKNARYHQPRHPHSAFSWDAPSEGGDASESPPAPSHGFVTVRYYRHDGAAAEFGLHVWEDVAEKTVWEAPLAGTLTDGETAGDGLGDWVVFRVPLVEDAARVSFIVHRGDEQDAKVESFDCSEATGARDLWIVGGNPKVFDAEPDLVTLPTGDVDLGKARALWLSQECVAVPFAVDASVQVELVASDSAGLTVENGGVVRKHDHGDLRYVPLELCPGGWGSPDASGAGDKYPHVRAAGYTIMRLPLQYVHQGYVPWLLKCQLAVAAKSAEGRLRDATSVQTHGAIDDAFGRYDGPLGCEVRPHGGGVAIRLWAPTARRVTLRVFDRPSGGECAFEVGMREEAGSGVWIAEGGADWEGRYYQYELEVFHPWADGEGGNVCVCHATDPYSRSLGADGERTHICDVHAPELKPPGWDALVKPATGSEPTDMAIYELHVRDFSALDESTPWDVRGKYLAFAERDSVPCRHLAGLADAGLTHVHLLPSYDFGSVPERRENQRFADHDWLATQAPDSAEQQRAIFDSGVADQDAFNWGYDPVHYGVPEGSYATDPDGSRRILEFRRMVQGLSDMGLKTICDVVYNHTQSAGPSDGKSVLDKIVPGYYHRRNFDGGYENSTCCNNTASENWMMERLIVDDLVHWARTYKIDGFRFDLMGHLMLRTILRARRELDALTLERDGVDGRGIYMYGEGWDYAEVERNRVGVNASQLNLGGTGIGSFNDRLREGIMGGSPFGDPRTQGVLTGLYFSPNGWVDQGDGDAQRKDLIEDQEKILIAMAGNLRDFKFVNKDGYDTPGRDACWVGSNVGYAAEPRETVNYVSAHDNETLFDGVQLRAAPSVDLETRCRLNRLAVAVVAFSQGVPFFHAGDEILRSKSLDRDSYNSGDWFNRLDYTMETHNFGVGLPGAEKNGDRYGYIAPLLACDALKPDDALIRRSEEHMREVLAIRRSSPLFRLRSAEEVKTRLTFYNTGEQQIPGAIVLGISDDPADGAREEICPHFKRIVVCVNFAPMEQTIADPRLKTDLAGAEMTAHPLQGRIAPDEYLLGATCVEGAVNIPGHTACVFVERR